MAVVWLKTHRFERSIFSRSVDFTLLVMTNREASHGWSGKGRWEGGGKGREKSFGSRKRRRHPLPSPSVNEVITTDLRGVMNQTSVLD